MMERRVWLLLLVVFTGFEAASTASKAEKTVSQTSDEKPSSEAKTKSKHTPKSVLDNEIRLHRKVARGSMAKYYGNYMPLFRRKRDAMYSDYMPLFKRSLEAFSPPYYQKRLVESAFGQPLEKRFRVSWNNPGYYGKRASSYLPIADDEDSKRHNPWNFAGFFKKRANPWPYAGFFKRSPETADLEKRYSIPWGYRSMRKKMRMKKYPWLFRSRANRSRAKSKNKRHGQNLPSWYNDEPSKQKRSRDDDWREANNDPHVGSPTGSQTLIFLEMQKAALDDLLGDYKYRLPPGVQQTVGAESLDRPWLDGFDNYVMEKAKTIPELKRRSYRNDYMGPFTSGQGMIGQNVLSACAANPHSLACYEIMNRGYTGRAYAPELDNIDFHKRSVDDPYAMPAFLGEPPVPQPVMLDPNTSFDYRSLKRNYM